MLSSKRPLIELLLQRIAIGPVMIEKLRIEDTLRFYGDSGSYYRLRVDEQVRSIAPLSLDSDRAAHAPAMGGLYSKCLKLFRHRIPIVMCCYLCVMSGVVKCVAI